MFSTTNRVALATVVCLTVGALTTPASHAGIGTELKEGGQKIIDLLRGKRRALEIRHFHARLACDNKNRYVASDLQDECRGGAQLDEGISHKHRGAHKEHKHDWNAETDDQQIRPIY